MLNDKPNLFAVPTKNSSALWGAVNNDGSLQISPIYKTLGQFNDDASLPSYVQTIDGQWGYINRSGVLIHPSNLDSARGFTEERLARFKKDNLWGFMAPSGEYAVEPKYQQASYFSNGYARVKINEGWTFINTDGKQLFNHTFKRLGDFSTAGLALAYDDKSGNYGYIDTLGNWAIEATFEYATDFGKANRAAVEKNERWGIINEKGDWIIKPTYNNMDPFGEKNFTAFYVDWDKGGLIDADGKIIFDHREKRFYDPRYYPHCNIVTTESYAPDFYNEHGVSLKRLNNSSYRLISGFDSQCASLALAGDNKKWTRLDSSGARSDFPNEVQEPHFTWRGENTVLTLPTGFFVPVILKDRGLAYLDTNNNIALRTHAESSASGDRLIVSDAKGNEIWDYRYEKNTLVENNQHHFFLTKGNLEFGYEKPNKENINAKITYLKQKEPAPFETSYGGDLESGDGDSFGAGVRLANATYAYFDHGSTYYHAIDWPNFESQFNEVKEVIESLLGNPVDDELVEDTLDENSIYGDNQAAWLLDGSILVLHDTYYEDGDVDHWASLNLLLIPTNETKSTLTSLTVVTAESLTMSDESAADVSKAIEKLKGNFKYNSAEGLRQLAVNVLDIAKTGKAISANDYLWAQFGQLYAASYDGTGELQVGTRQEYIDLASNTLDFLDDNGVGQDHLTAEGQTRLEIYRYAANGAAWELREDEPKLALSIIERALKYARPEDTYLYDTQVRILLNLDRQQDAFSIVKNVLDENPWYEDFNDFTENKKYKKWVKKQGGKFVAYDDIPSTSKYLKENQTIAIAPKGNKLAAYWNNELHMFDISSGNALFKVNTGTYHPFSMKFNNDGDQLISSGWNEVAIWDATTGKKLVTRNNNDSNSKCAGFSANAQEYFYESELYDGNSLSISNYANRHQFNLKFGHNCNTSNDNRLLAVNGQSDDQRDQIQVIDLEKQKVIANLIGEQANPYDDDLFFVQNNQRLLVRDYSNFHLWDISNASVETTWDTGSLDVDEVIATNDFLFVLDGDQWIARLWHFDEKPGGDIILPIPDYANGSESYRGFKINKSQTHYVVATKNKEGNLRYIFLFDFNTHKLLKEFVIAENFGEIFFSNNDQHLILDSYPIQIVDLESGAVTRRISRPN